MKHTKKVPREVSAAKIRITHKVGVRMFEAAAQELGLKFAGDIHTDVFVMGGGFAGIGAAVGAAKSGAEVLLIEKYGFLGGMATAAAVSTICGAYSADKQKKDYRRYSR